MLDQCRECGPVLIRHGSTSSLAGYCVSILFKKNIRYVCASVHLCFFLNCNNSGVEAVFNFLY